MPERISFTPENARNVERTIDVLEVKVPSNSDPNKFYYVSISATCQCQSFLYRSKCAHIHQVLDQLMPRPEKMK